jgi:uncharacterized protein YbjT (DUF2867 family)
MSRRAALAGATGLVGQSLLAGLLADPLVEVVHTFGRRAPAGSDHKLNAHVVDFASMPVLPAIDEVYLALGTTIKVAGSRESFRAIDFDANMAVALAAKAAGATRAGVVSAMSADARSSVFYNRVKGELEHALRALGFEALVIARPSLLLGNRDALGQPPRRIEAISIQAARWLAPLIPANYRAISAADVAKALLARVPVAQGVEVLSSGDMQQPA